MQRAAAAAAAAAAEGAVRCAPLMRLSVVPRGLCACVRRYRSSYRSRAWGRGCRWRKGCMYARAEERSGLHDATNSGTALRTQACLVSVPCSVHRVALSALAGARALRIAMLGLMLYVAAALRVAHGVARRLRHACLCCCMQHGLLP